MLPKIADIKAQIESVSNLQELDQARLSLVGKSGSITELLKAMRDIPNEEKKSYGQAVNQLKVAVNDELEARKSVLDEQALNAKLESEQLDITLPVRDVATGSVHPITAVMDELIEIFGTMGFSYADANEIEDDFHNFTALNIPEDHPARQMHDTFYTKNGVLRTHTSSVQIRTMMAGKPPFRIIAPGKTYRSDSDVTHSPMFHQIEGLVVDKNITMAHLRGCLQQFIDRFFEKDGVKLRFRPSYFPFTEPSAEMDIGCEKQAGGTFEIGKGEDWLEILGCGMVHPNVLKNVGVDSNEYQGFAFGIGIERLAMLKYNIADLRTFFDSDSRWLKHYGF